MESPLIEALRDPSRYPHPVDKVELIETHISWVLLAGDRVYKIKKPVDFGFLDFSTLEKRLHFCREEVRLNQRTAPGLYLGVEAVTGSVEQPALGGDGQPIEYAACMRRFDVADGFDQLIDHGRFQPAHAESLGDALADLHEKAAVAGIDDNWGRAETVIGPMRDNFSTLFERIDDPTRRQQLETLHAWTEQQFEALADLVEQRRQSGFVRECHGDVHLGNVTLFEGQTTLFDCIEFSPDLRWTDVMADLAFVIMDLHDRGDAANAWRLLDRYLARTGDHSGLALLDFFIVYRAMVRAKVAALGLEPGLDDEQMARIRRRVDRYIQLSSQVSAGSRPLLVLTCGVSGSGKSHLAERLLARCGLVRLRSDVERKRLFGLSEAQRSGSGLAAGIYSAAAGEQTYAELRRRARQLLAAGFGVVVDATFLAQAQRAEFRALAGEQDCPFAIITCFAEQAVLRERVQHRARKGADASEADEAVLTRQLSVFEGCAREEGALLEIDTAKAGGADRAAEWVRSLRKMSEPRQARAATAQ